MHKTLMQRRLLKVALNYLCMFGGSHVRRHCGGLCIHRQPCLEVPVVVV